GINLALLRDHNGNKNYDGYNSSPRAQRKLQEMITSTPPHLREETRYGIIMCWSDSFLLSFYRQKENSIWLFVVRICPPEGFSTSLEHTFCLAFGQSKLNHDRVISFYMKEIRDVLRKGQFCFLGKEGVQKKVNTCFALGPYLADTPERNKIEHVLHLGLYGKRSMHAVKLDSNKLASCSICFWEMVIKAKQLTRTLRQQSRTRKRSHSSVDSDDSDDESNKRKCNRCCNWDHFTESSAKLFDKTAGTDYPTTASVNNPYEYPENCAPGETFIVCQKQSFTWLVQCIRVAFWEHTDPQGTWHNKKTVRDYLATFTIDKETAEKVISAATRKRNGYRVDESDYIPELWTLGYEMWHLVETLMHLIGHGVIASVLELICSVLADNELWTSFQNFANPILGDIASFRLEWCSLKSLPKKKMARGTLFWLWSYSTVLNHTAIPFLLKELKRVTLSCQVMVGFIMLKKKIPREVLDAHIKVFLSCCHHFCQEYYHPSVAPVWFGKANFVSLLNLPEQIEKDGPIGAYWDGSFE
ncbi:hypothetical protein ACHAWF_007131, partial [Thalassiosira exigua]